MTANAGLLLLGLLVSVTTSAGEAPIALLEFIGDWQEVDGEWVDPVSIDESNILGGGLTEGELSNEPTDDHITADSKAGDIDE